MITVRRSEARGHFDHGWLDTRHTFSFADYHDPGHMGFRTLRVINEDRVAPGQGFGTHGHRDMEILSYVLSGRLAHRDSMGTGSTIGPGEVQRMTAGTGVLHSEFNGSDSEPVRFLQIWILPERRGLLPGYEQKQFPEEERRGRLRLVASRDGADGSVTIHQDARVYAALLGAGERAVLPLEAGRHAWVQVARGTLRLGDETLAAGDGAAMSDEREVRLEGVEAAEVLVFDLA
ncbi:MULTISPECIES: pirin family protein [unclassified Anaeromyxobacter]|uniref:pirin family protein n=1 Tax=unclassified Anaeromyxobacter TaxID=2620896 RepID=UPI001F58453F|nr:MULTISPECIES: pirin family protein [unclassified Anaeromyxobacter]